MKKIEVLIDRDHKRFDREALEALREAILRKGYAIEDVGVYETRKGYHLYIILRGSTDDPVGEAIHLAEVAKSDKRAIEEARRRYRTSGGRRGLYLFAVKRVPEEDYLSVETYRRDLTEEVRKFLRGDRV